MRPTSSAPVDEARRKRRCRHKREKDAEITGGVPPGSPTHGDIRRGFVYERVPHITRKSIANNSEIDVIWEEKQPAVETALSDLNGAVREHNLAE
jgi:adenine-specific DNA-methyltransferase